MYCILGMRLAHVLHTDTIVSLARLSSSQTLLLSGVGRKRVWCNSHRQSVMIAHE